MIDIFWKEIREQRLLALGGFVAMSIAAILAILERDIRILFSDEFQAGMICVCAVYGLLLGIFQTVPERLLGRWEFLIHRPVDRKRIFRGKVMAGLALYVAAVVPPFLAALFWFATSGNAVGHLHQGMALPGAVDILGGVPYYFAGLIAGTRDRRLQVGRLIGLVIALPGTLAICLAPTFPWALAWAVLTGALLAPVAHGSFLRGGTFAGQPAPSRLALVMCQLLVFSILFGGVGLVIDMARWFEARGEYEKNRPPPEGSGRLAGGAD